MTKEKNQKEEKESVFLKYPSAKTDEQVTSGDCSGSGNSAEKPQEEVFLSWDEMPTLEERKKKKKKTTRKRKKKKDD